jgi:SAM-dependent methyltransferase
MESPVNALPPTSTFLGGLQRSIRLFQGFRAQFDDANGFYTLLADDTVALIEEHQSVGRRRVVDIGGGPGYFAEAFRRAGAQSIFVEPYWDAMTSAGRMLGRGVIGDGMRLPFADCAFDMSHSSNVLEHVTDPLAFFGEMIRVVRPGGLVFLAFTNWYSPFGGHETSPWHYLGGARAAKRYERRLGYPPKNRYGVSLFPLHVGDVLGWARSQPGVEVLEAFPRYYPRWTRRLVEVPGLREVATWNLAIVMRRAADAPPVRSGQPEG